MTADNKEEETIKRLLLSLQNQHPEQVKKIGENLRALMVVMLSKAVSDTLEIKHSEAMELVRSYLDKW
jgi:hypothetical protein